MKFWNKLLVWLGFCKKPAFREMLAKSVSRDTVKRERDASSHEKLATPTFDRLIEYSQETKKPLLHAMEVVSGPLDASKLFPPYPTARCLSPEEVYEFAHSGQLETSRREHA